MLKRVNLESDGMLAVLLEVIVIVMSVLGVLGVSVPGICFSFTSCDFFSCSCSEGQLRVHL